MSEATSTVIVTDHAYARGKERFSLSAKALKRFAEKAYLEGMHIDDTKGRLNRYLTKLWHNGKANNIRVYGEIVFLFDDNRLVTVYQLQNHLKKNVKYSKGKQA